MPGRDRGDDDPDAPAHRRYGLDAYDGPDPGVDPAAYERQQASARRGWIGPWPVDWWATRPDRTPTNKRGTYGV